MNVRLTGGGHTAIQTSHSLFVGANLPMLLGGELRNC